MAEDRIDSIIDRSKVSAEIEATKKEVQTLVDLVKSVKGKAIEISGAKSLSELSALRKELELLKKQTDVSAEAAIKEAKARDLNAKAALSEAKAVTETSKAKKIDADSAAKQAAANEKAKKKAEENAGAYKQLAIRFTAAANEAKNLAAQYGLLDPRARAAAKTALDLNNQLKAIDSSIGNHQRNVGNYASAWEGAGSKIKQAGQFILGLVGITAGASFLESSIEQFLELDKALRLLQNTTRNLGVPELFDRISNKTEELQKQFKFLANEDIASSFNKLLVYGKLSENQINDLLPVIVDFSAATGQSLPEATSLLIKALEGNGRALKEFGINMKDAKTPAEGLSLIMEELAPRVEGVGKTFGESAAGGLAAAREEFKQLKEEIGGKLTPVLVSVLGAFNNILTGLGYLGTKLKETTQDFFDFFGGAQGLANQVIKEVEKYNAEVKAGAALIVDTFRDKTPLEIGEEIVQVQVRIGELNKLLKAAKANKSGTFSTEDVDKFKKGIDVNKAALKELFSLQFSDKNKPLGDFGNDAAKNEAAIKKQTEALKRGLEDEATAILAFNKFRLEQEQEYLKFTRDNIAFAPSERIKAAQEIAEKQKQIIDAQTKYELDKLNENQAALKAKGELTLAEENAIAYQRKLINAKAASDILQIDVDLAKETSKVRFSAVEDQRQVNDEINALFDEQYKKEQDAAKANLDKLAKINEQRLDVSGITADQALTALNNSYAKGEISKQDFEDKKLKIERAALLESLNIQLDYYEKLIAMADLSAEARADAEKKLAKIRREISEQGTTDYNSDEEKRKAAILKSFDEIAEAARGIGDVLGSALENSLVKEKNLIQEQIDLLEEKKQKDIEVANATIANAQDRAAAITVIEARAAAQRQILETRQRQLDERKAKYDKAISIMNIILNTARAVTAALTSTPPNVPLAVITGVIGAAQLATAVASPIPKYREGTPGHKGGPAIVGDGGRSEAIQLPDGTLVKSPAHSTLMNLPEGTIVHPDYNKMVLSATFTKVPTFKINTESTTNDRAIAAAAKDIVKAIKSQPRDLSQNEPRYKRMLKVGNDFKTYLDNTL